VERVGWLVSSWRMFASTTGVECVSMATECLEKHVELGKLMGMLSQASGETSGCSVVETLESRCTSTLLTL
jgi:hypothetical protein